VRVAHHSEIPYDTWPSIRGPNALHRTLLQGVKGRPDNFEFGIATFKNDGNGSPRHRHVFDQFRYALKGEIEYNPGEAIPEGCLGFFSEGTPYGPFKIHPRTELLSLQFGGPSGQGFVHRQDLSEAQLALAKQGAFEKGIYTWHDAAGKKHNEDSHKAVWRRATGGEEVQFPEPRFKDPLLIYPQNYKWRDIGAGISEKLLGVFNERNTYAKMLRIAKGASWAREPGPQANIFFVIDGAMSIDGGDVCQKQDAFYLEAGDRARLAAMTETTLLIFGMPAFQ
jgi:hypothetical protein